jgi:predicted ATPase/DNA-binding SARP family transcriptional activator
MTTLELRCLGGLSIHQDGRPLTALKSQKGQALLCYLALTGKAYTRSALAGLLWPEMPEAYALTNLRTVLNKLNQHLGSHLAITRQTIAMNQDASSWVDVTEFEAGLASKGDTGRLQAAVALYQGDFLEGFDLDDAPAFDGWVLAQRARLREAALAALHHLISHFTIQGDYETAITYARQLLAIEPWQEEAHRELMRLLALSGQRSAALVQYETGRRILAEELGVEPAPATVELYEQIKDNQLIETPLRTLSLRPPPVQEPAATSPPHNLPAPSTLLIGRETELAKLNQLLTQPDGRLLTIFGVGGIGKTRLALGVAGQQIATPQRDNPYSNGVYFVPLAPLSEASHILPTLAQAIGFPLQANDPRPPEQQVLDYLRRKRILLLFDNFEHVLEGATLLVAILQAAPRVEILVTSREPLRLYEEQLFALQGLSFSEEAAAEEDAAVQLFLQRARWMQPDFVLREADRPHLTTICRQTGGNPLALELAAAWVDTLTLAEIAGELAQSLDLLRTKWRNVPDRHQSIRATFELSWQRLFNDEQQIFSRLSVFRGGFTRTAAWEVCAPEMSQPALQRILAALASKSFLRYVSTSDRYDLHELLRQFAAEKLAQMPDEETAARDRHSAHYLAALWEQEAKLKGESVEAALTEIGANIENASLAWNWAVHRGNFAAPGRAAYSLATFYLRTHRFREGREAFDQAVEKMNQTVTEATVAESDDLQVLSRLLGWQSRMLLALGSAGAAERCSLEALTLLEQPALKGHDIRLDKALALLHMGGIYQWLDRHVEATTILEESLSLFRSLGERSGMADAISALAEVALRSAACQLAIQRFTEAQQHYLALGNRRAVASMQRGIGMCQDELWPSPQGERLLRQSLTVFREVGDQSAEASVLYGLADNYLFRGDFAEASNLFSKYAALYDHLGMKDWWARGISAWSWVVMHQGEYDLALNRLEPILEIVETSEMPYLIGWSHFVQGSIRLALGQCAEAQKLLNESSSILRDASQREDLSWALAALSCARIESGEVVQARESLGQALQLTQELRTFPSTMHPLTAVALLLAKQVASERAVELYALVCRQDFVANSRWFHDIVGRHVEAAAAELPSKVVEAAQERGQTLDLWETAAALLGELGDG